MSKAVEAFDYLHGPGKFPPRPVCVLFGDESFLKRQVLASLRQQVLGSEEGEFSQSVFCGPDASFREVFDDLNTLALFGGGQRLVVVEDADDFVSANRPALENYVAKPNKCGVLVLQAKAWAASTRLYKALAETGLQVECKFPTPAKLLKWLTSRAKERHGAQLEPAAAELLIEIVEPELGLFDQELAKLASLIGADAKITAAMVREAVAGWRAQTTWQMLDEAVSGNAREALLQLERLLLGGEAPIALLGQIGATLRRFAAAARLAEQAGASRRRITLRQALEQAGFKGFVVGKAESQLRQIGPARAARLYGWLLEADLALKGSSSSPPRARLVLEKLVAQLSTAASPSSR